MDGARDASDGFQTIDGKMTVFALANGMDLVKDPAERRLEWFRDGLERGIRVEPDRDGTLRVGVCAWPFGGRDRAVERPHAERVAAQALSSTLEAAIEAANALALEAGTS